MCISPGINQQQEQQANGTLLQSNSSSSSQQQQQMHTPPSSARTSSRLGPLQDQQQQQQRQGTPTAQQQRQQQQQQLMLVDVEQHPGLKALLALVQGGKLGSKEASAVLSDGQTVPTIVQVRGADCHPNDCDTAQGVDKTRVLAGRRGIGSHREPCQALCKRSYRCSSAQQTPAALSRNCHQRSGLGFLPWHAHSCNRIGVLRSLTLTHFACVCGSCFISVWQALCPPQADGTSSRLQAWLSNGQLPWLLQAAGALLGHAEGLPEATDLQVGCGFHALLFS